MEMKSSFNKIYALLGSHSKLFCVYPDLAPNTMLLLNFWIVKVVVSESVLIDKESHAFSLYVS